MKKGKRDTGAEAHFCGRLGDAEAPLFQVVVRVYARERYLQMA
jgi:hypothetical protein